jgi:hypothetical protein
MEEIKQEEVTQVKEDYGADSIKVLEGLEASGHVYREHREGRAPPSGL